MKNFFTASLDPCTVVKAATCGKNLFDKGGIFNEITNTLLFIAGAAAVLFIIIGGLRYVLSSGNEKAITGAKDTILYAIIGVIVTVIAYAIVNFVLTSIK